MPMAVAPSVSASFSALSLPPSRLGGAHLRPCSIFLSPPCPSLSFAASFSPGRQLGFAVSASKNKKGKKKKQVMPGSRLAEDEELDDDAFEALFKQLEEDLKNDKDLSFDDDDLEISEEDFAKLESELKEALGVDDAIDIFGAAVEKAEGDYDDDNDESEQVDDDKDVSDDDDKEEEEVETPVELKRWQLRRLASALKAGRRKTSIKSLASELGLDRSIVLELLRDPPPDLLMMSATLPDEPEPVVSVQRAEAVEVEVVHDKATADAAEPEESKVKAPLHVMQQRWSAQKRLKKVQVETLESVYRKTKRPTNAMVSSIVQVTSLPRKRIVKWFEDRRSEEGVPNQRVPYQRPEPETASSS